MFVLTCLFCVLSRTNVCVLKSVFHLAKTLSISKLCCFKYWPLLQRSRSLNTGHLFSPFPYMWGRYFPCDCNSRPSLSLRFTDWKIVRWQRLLVVVSRNCLRSIAWAWCAVHASSSDCRKEQLSG